MRFVLFVMVIAGLVVATVAPASAITHGTVDTEHPEVGALIGDAPERDGTWAYCTGTLISPTVFLTAAHCGHKGQKTARVSFAGHYKAGGELHAGRFVPDPRYTGKNELHDMAVVVFPTPVRGITPAMLPSLGLLDRLEADGVLKTARFTPVGYGSVEPTKNRHELRFHYTDTRSRTSISFKNLRGRWLELAPDSRDEGGTCYGDSGGPNYLGGPSSKLLVATTISGLDDACQFVNLDYRLDTPSARKFLRDFVALP